MEIAPCSFAFSYGKTSLECSHTRVMDSYAAPEHAELKIRALIHRS